MTNRNEVIQTLKQEAQRNPAADAVFHVWALRKRTRGAVTIGALVQKMRNEGFNYDRGAYESLLKTLASVGVGKLEQNSKGRILALKEVKTTLQSLGKAICEKEENIRSFRPRTQYKPVPAPEKASAPTPGLKVQLSVVVNNKNVVLPTEGLSNEEITLLLNRLSQNKRAIA